MENNKYLTVSALNKYIGYKIDTDVNLKVIYIKGELSNVRSSKNHIYFVLKDEESEISGIIFANNALRLKFTPKDGTKVLIEGSVSSYFKKGNYNLIANKMEEYGEGLIYKKYLELKDKLEKEGLFDISRKKKLKDYCFNIGVITSDAGDAIKDITTTIQKRFPLAKVFLYPSLVQGQDAPASLISCLQRAYKDTFLDCIIIGRGGGSFEDLNCFNDQDLAYCISNSPIPIISAVGHENDFTIIDFVSDYRAPTPTGAAFICTKDKEVLISDFLNIDKKLLSLINQKCLKAVNDYNKNVELLKVHSPNNYIKNCYIEIVNLEKRLSLYDINNKIKELGENINSKLSKLNNYLEQNIINYQHKFEKTIDKLILVNPLNIMKKGYTLIYKTSNLVTSVNDLKKDDLVKINFHDGEIKAKIEGD